MPFLPKLAHCATQLPLFQSPPQEPNWGSIPPEIQQQIERLLARMLRQHAARLSDVVPSPESGDE